MLVYDEVFRRSWAQRVQQSDPALRSLEQLEETATVLDKQMLEIARIRVASVMDAAGLGGGSQPKALADIEESVHNKQNAALEAMQKRSQAAAKSAVQRQEEMLRKESALAQSHSEGEGRIFRSDGGNHTQYRQGRYKEFMDRAHQKGAQKQRGGSVAAQEEVPRPE